MKTLKDTTKEYWSHVMKGHQMTPEDMKKLATGWQKFIDDYYSLTDEARKNRIISTSPGNSKFASLLDELLEEAKRINHSIKAFVRFDLEDSKAKVRDSKNKKYTVTYDFKENGTKYFYLVTPEGEAYYDEDGNLIRFSSFKRAEELADDLNESNNEGDLLKDIEDAIWFLEGELEYIQRGMYIRVTAEDDAHQHIVDQFKRRGWDENFSKEVENHYTGIKNVSLPEAIELTIQWLEKQK